MLNRADVEFKLREGGFEEFETDRTRVQMLLSHVMGNADEQMVAELIDQGMKGRSLRTCDLAQKIVSAEAILMERASQLLKEGSVSQQRQRELRGKLEGAGFSNQELRRQAVNQLQRLMEQQQQIKNQLHQTKLMVAQLQKGFAGSVLPRVVQHQQFLKGQKTDGKNETEATGLYAVAWVYLLLTIGLSFLKAEEPNLIFSSLLLAVFHAEYFDDKIAVLLIKALAGSLFLDVAWLVLSWTAPLGMWFPPFGMTVARTLVLVNVGLKCYACYSLGQVGSPDKQDCLRFSCFGDQKKVVFTADCPLSAAL